MLVVAARGSKIHHVMSTELLFIRRLEPPQLGSRNARCLTLFLGICWRCSPASIVCTRLDCCYIRKMFSLSNLPPELLAVIFSFLDRNSLRNFRRTCRSFSRSATKELYKVVHLFPDDEGLESFGNILAEDRLLQNILTICIHTSNYVSDSFLCAAELHYRFIKVGA